MAVDAFTAALAFTIGYGVPGYGEEGGEADVPGDPGGFTWRGITLSAYQSWIGNSAFNAEQLLQLSEDQIVAFYGANYWNPISGNDIPPAIAVGVFDFGVNAGPYRAAVTLQSCLGVTQDGSIGPETEGAAASANLSFLIGRYSQQRLAFYQSLTGEAEFLAGWTNRTNACEAAMTALLPSAPQSMSAYSTLLARLWFRGRGARRPSFTTGA